jgi:hypothetical protein
MSGAGGEGKVVNVLATGSVDQSVKVRVPFCPRGE